MGGDDNVDYFIWNISMIFGSLSDCVDETPDYVKNQAFFGEYNSNSSVFLILKT